MRAKEIVRPVIRPLLPVLLALCAACLPASLPAQQPAAGVAPPPSTGGVFPLSEVRRGMKATAWTVFTGTAPEPMEVEILGVLRGGRGPGQDMILAQLHGPKPEYTGVVAGMSGSPVYIGAKLLGSLSYRIGQFSKDPIAGITPIEQMLAVRDLPFEASTLSAKSAAPVQPDKPESSQFATGNMQFQAMETPLLMSGFHPEAVKLWQQRMAGTGLEAVTAGGVGGSSQPQSAPESARQALAAVVPGSAVSALLVRGDVEMAATCTVTYIDPRQLLACGHPLFQSGPVSLPMTTAEVVATLASPLNAFKIINTGATIGAFSEDRDAAIRGILGAKAQMIPMHIRVQGQGSDRKLNVEILDQPDLTPQAMMITLYEALLENNESTAENSYHLTGSIDLEGQPRIPLELWASSGDGLPAATRLALDAGDRFFRLYRSGSRVGAVRGIQLNVTTIPRSNLVALQSARLVSGNMVHAGDLVSIEATLRPWQQPARNLRIAVRLPAALPAGNLRLLISDAGTLDRSLDQPRNPARPVEFDALRAQAERQHPADRIYVSLLAPDPQAGVAGQTLAAVPLSLANALEPLRAAQDATLNGESAELLSQTDAGGVLTGFQLLNLRIEPGGGLD